MGSDGTGVIYGCREVINRLEANGGSFDSPAAFTNAPEAVPRGGCVDVQKMEYLPGHDVYECLHTPGNFP